MKERPVKDRIRNFAEVTLGFSEKEALQEAKRCLQCKKSLCIAGCPVEVNIPKFIKETSQGDFAPAIKTIKETNALPGICGRVCPQENQCEKTCVLARKGKPINIGALERFAADWEMMHQKTENRKQKTESIIRKPKKMAIVGSGPAGLTCAGELAKMGYAVTIFESLHAGGGVLRYGIPEFRLPRKILDREIEYVESLGVEIEYDMLIGKTYTLPELFTQGYQAIFVATGAGYPHFLHISGENANGVYSANEFLTRNNLMKGYNWPNYDTPLKIGKRVGVIGGGNVAMDSARVALRLGAQKVYLIYRRSEKEMPARLAEIEHGKEEGIVFHFLTQPLKIKVDKDGWVEGMECIKMRLGEPDESGRRRPLPIEGSNFFLPLETVVIAIGQSPNPLIPTSTPQLKLGKKGNILTDEKMATSLEGVFAGGDIATGAATVIEAMGAGRKAARSMDKYVRKNVKLV